MKGLKGFVLGVGLAVVGGVAWAALEDLTGSSKYIDDLVPANPVGTSDLISQGDDHIRGIKNVLQNTITNDGVPGALIPSGSILMFVQGTQPSGWDCVYAADDVVPMIESTVAQGGTTGGSWTIAGLSSGLTAINTSQMPAHTHSGTTGQQSANHSHTYTAPVGAFNPTTGAGGVGAQTTTAATSGISQGHVHSFTTDATGGNQGHNHTIAQNGAWRPSYIKVILCSPP